MSDELLITEAEVVESETDIYEKNGIMIYDTYDTMIERLVGRAKQEATAIVEFRWKIGAQVKMALETAAYGTHKMDDLVRDIGWSDKTLYACQTLFETYTREELDTKIIPNGVPFRSLNYITRIHDDEKREEYLDKVIDGEVKAEDIPKLIKAEKEETASGGGSADDAEPAGMNLGVSDSTPQSAEQKAAGNIRRAMGEVEAPLDIVLAHLDIAIKSLDEMDLIADDGLYERVCDDISVMRDKVDNCQPKLAALSKRITTIAP
jgi:hypothetical protein